ncbi:MAG: hypothetical protein ACK6D5_08015, partial [Planctomyces sp.]
MTNSDADPRKKTDDFAKNLVHAMFGLDKLPAEVGGEVLFDDYDDAPAPGTSAAAAQSSAAAEIIEATSESANSRTEYQDDIDDLIMFPEDDDHDEVAEADEEDDDENFDFGSDEDSDEADDEDDEDEDEDDADEVAPPQAGARPARVIAQPAPAEPADEFGFDSDPPPQARETARPAPRAARDEEPRRDREDRGRRGGDRDRDGGRGRGRGGDRGRSAGRDRDRGPDRDDRPRGAREETAPTGKTAAGGGGDDAYWDELDKWVWDDSESAAQDAPASVAEAAVEDEDFEGDSVERPAPSDDADAGAAGGRRRGRRRGGRGLNRRRSDESTGSRSDAIAGNDAGSADVYDDLSEI